MKYENRQPKEGINVSDKNPLADFTILIVGTFVILVLISTFVAYGMGWLAKKIPFDYEQTLVKSFAFQLNDKSHAELESYLKKLSERIMACSDLPDDISVQIHYLDKSDFNAFATLGGHVFLYRGLLQRMESENQLAMVIGHEIAHIRNRDPVVGLGRGAVISVAFSMILGHSPSILGDAGLLTVLSFSRSMEADSDALGITALNRCYGHVNGSWQTFELFKKVRDDMGLVASQLTLFETHPLDENRIKDIKSFATDQGFSLNGKLVPLPEEFSSWLQWSAD